MKKHLHILWKTDDLDTARHMVLFYATNARMNHLWDDITVILWGSPVKLVTENEVIAEEIKMAQHVGVKFSACLSCARRLGVVDEVNALGIETIPWVEPLTHLIQENQPIIYA